MSHRSRRAAGGAALLVALLAAACSGGAAHRAIGTPGVTGAAATGALRTSTAGGTPTGSPAPLSTAPDGCVEIGTATVVDAGTAGRPLPAVLVGGGLRAVILVNAEGQNLCRWLPFARSLARAGLRAVLYDGPAADPAATVRELAGWLRDRGTREVAYVGAGSGASAVLAAASVAPGPYAVVVLSPPPTVPIRHGVLAVAATGDATAAAVCRRLAAVGGTLRLVPGSARGTGLLTGAGAGRLVAELLSYLRG